MQYEAGFITAPRILFRVNVPSGGLRQLRLIERPIQPFVGTATVQGTDITNTQVRCDGERILFTTCIASRRDAKKEKKSTLPCCASLRDAKYHLTPRLEITEDGTDTWSHGVDRYPEGPVVAALQWHGVCHPESGSLMASLLTQGSLGAGEVHAEWRVYDAELFCELRLRVHWMERRKILKLRFPAPNGFFTPSRLDGTMGDATPRRNDGREQPVRDWTLLPLAATDYKLGIVMPDTFALDATEHRLRLTLLRSPIMAHHEPHRGHTPREIYSDQGVHEFRFRFFLSQDITPEQLEHHAQMLNKPLLLGDLTEGM